MATCMAILHVGTTQQVRTGSTSSKEEDYENDAATIVQKCVSRWEGVQLLVFFFSFLASEMYRICICLDCSRCILFLSIRLADKVIELANCG